MESILGINFRTGRLRHLDNDLCEITYNVLEAVAGANQMANVILSSKNYIAAGAQKGVLSIGIMVFCDHT